MGRRVRGHLSLPKYSDFIIPAVQAVEAFGGSAKAGEVRGYVLENLDDADRIAKLIGGLKRPSQGLYLLTALD